MKQSIAVVSFLPDAGHVLPLLRVAAEFFERGYNVVCYLPQECANYLSGYEFEFVSLGPAINDVVRASYDKVLLKLSRSSVFYNAFSSYIDLSSRYWEPLKLSAGHQLALIQPRLANQRPLFLLSDDHVFRIFRSLYIKIAHELEIPIILHSTDGYLPFQSEYVQVYGISDLPRRWQMLIEYLGSGSKNLFKLRELLNWLRRSISKGVFEQIRARVLSRANRATVDSTYQPITFSTGWGYLEKKYLKSKLRICDDLFVFGPLIGKSTSKLPANLKQWLERSSAPTVYISFGTLVRLEVEFVQAILDGLALLNVRALWSIPKSQQAELFPKLRIQESVRFSDFVPPLEVLAIPNVRCGINHGGSGSIQDCLLSGKPMLCIPFMWDQPFNSSVIAHLQVGKRLWRRQVSVGMISQTIGSMLYDEQIALRASKLAACLRHSCRGSDVVEFILRSTVATS